jgi:hypothetical protein
LLSTTSGQDSKAQQEDASTSPPHVENWQMVSLINLPNDPKISDILNSTPEYVILSQPAAVIIHGAMALQVKLEPDEATETFKGALSKWAWNFDINGALKGKASLTL